MSSFTSLLRKKKIVSGFSNILLAIKVCCDVLRCTVVFCNVSRPGGGMKLSHNSCITWVCLLICLIYAGQYFVLSEQGVGVCVGLWPGQLVWCMVVSLLRTFSRRNKSACTWFSLSCSPCASKFCHYLPMWQQNAKSHLVFPAVLTVNWCHVDACDKWDSFTVT